MIRNVISLFDGAGIGALALKRSGITYGKYYASEVDKTAMLVAKKNNPEIIHIGDVKNWPFWRIDWKSVDLIIGGSPCQGFSMAGNGLNFNDPRSKLFFSYVEVLNYAKHFNPNVRFLLENVIMKKKEWEDYISSKLGVGCVRLNSSLTSAQNRVRCFWGNFKITEPEDMGITLECILETHEMTKKASIIGRRINANGNREDYNKNIPIIQCLEVRDSKGSDTSKSNCLTTLSKDTVLTSMPFGRHKHAYSMKEKWRDYTTKERCRLMNWPDAYLDGISKNQAVKLTGNGWELGVIVHIFKCLFN